MVTNSPLSSDPARSSQLNAKGPGLSLVVRPWTPHDVEVLELKSPADWPTQI